MLREDKILYFSLMGSCFVHVVAVLTLSYTGRHDFQNRKKNFEVTYSVSKAENVNGAAQAKNNETPRRKEATRNPNRPAGKDTFPDQLVKDSARKISKELVSQGKISSRLDGLEIKKKVSIPVLESEKISNPKYQSYHDKIRQRIKERAYLYVEHPDFKVGAVYLTFVLLSDGSLKEIKIIEDQTQANQYLRGVGLKSVKESSPFPAFPDDLKYPELSFNVVISFELKN